MKTKHQPLILQKKQRARIISDNMESVTDKLKGEEGKGINGMQPRQTDQLDGLDERRRRGLREADKIHLVISSVRPRWGVPASTPLTNQELKSESWKMANLGERERWKLIHQSNHAEIIGTAGTPEPSYLTSGCSSENRSKAVIHIRIQLIYT